MIEKLKPMNCVNCGGIINSATLICQSCGTPYRYDEQNRLRLIHSELRFETLHGSIFMPAYFVEENPQRAMEITLVQMAEKMSEKLLPFIEYRQSFDVPHYEYITHGRIKVAIPGTTSFTTPIWNDKKLLEVQNETNT